MNQLLDKLTFNKGGQIVVIIVANILAPYSFLRHFRPPLIQEENIIKVLLNCLAVGVPISGLGYVIEIRIMKSRARKIAKYQDEPRASLASQLGFRELENETEEQRQQWDLVTGRIIMSSLNNSSITTFMALYAPCLVSFFVPLTFKEAAISCFISWIVLCFGSYLEHNMSKIKPLDQDQTPSNTSEAEGRNDAANKNQSSDF